MHHLGCGICCQMRRMHRRELERHAAGADQHVGLARREAHALHAEAREVELARGRRHELDGAARRAERHRPERVRAAPVDEEVEPRRDPAFLRLRVVRDDSVVRARASVPLQRSLLPDVDEPDEQNEHEHEHLAEAEERDAARPGRRR